MEPNLVRTSPNFFAAVGLLSETIKWLHPLQGTPYMYGSNSCGYPPIRTCRGAFVSSTKHSTTSIQEALMQKATTCCHFHRSDSPAFPERSFISAGFFQSDSQLARAFTPLRAFLKTNRVVECNSWLDGAAKLFC